MESPADRLAGRSHHATAVLKHLERGAPTRAFEAERQALAMMDHPNIAKVLDAGTTDLGRPYFVMELVRGINQRPPGHSRDDLRIDAAESRMLAGSVAQGQAELEKLAEEFKQRGPTARRALARSLAKLGNCLRLLNQRPDAEPADLTKGAVLGVGEGQV